jgi:hypothetical protein
MRRWFPAKFVSVVLGLTVGLLVAGAFAGGAAADTRCCKPLTPPKTGHGGLPLTGMPLYLPVLASLALIGTGVALRRRTRESSV